MTEPNHAYLKAMDRLMPLLLATITVRQSIDRRGSILSTDPDFEEMSAYYEALQEHEAEAWALIRDDWLELTQTVQAAINAANEV